MWRLVDPRIAVAHLPGIRAARADARSAACAAGAAPATGGWLHLHVDDTITINHSDGKEIAAATWKKTFGHHPLRVFFGPTRPRQGARLGTGIATGRPTRSRRAADPGALRFRRRHPHIRRRVPPRRGRVLLGYAVNACVRDAVEVLTATDSWYPAIDSDGIRDCAWVAEATCVIEMSGCPRTRLILRKGSPPPRGAAYGSPTPTATGSPRSSPTPHPV